MKTEFLVGNALRPRGLKGELRFELYTSDPMRFRSIQQFKLGDKAFDVEKISVEGDFAYIKFVGIDTVEDLTNRTEDDMIKVRNLGKKSLEEVIQKLQSLGLSLKKMDD